MRYFIVCEGESEWVYLQRLQGFLDRQPVQEFDLCFIAPQRGIAKGGAFTKLRRHYNATLKSNRNVAIKIWADFDLYHRNDQKCAEHYAAKAAGIPDFHFSFHNFEDFYALHFDGAALQDWLQFGGVAGKRHFSAPLHSNGYMSAIKRIFPGYTKGELPGDFVSWDSLRNLKSNLGHQPKTNPYNLRGVGSFAEFLIEQIENTYPGKLG
jgi:hypothetical protein